MRRLRSVAAGALAAPVLLAAAAAAALAWAAPGSRSTSGVSGSATGAVPPAQRAAVAGAVGRAVVDIDTSLGYQQAAAAGTGMVLSAGGIVLTNNHVIRGATKLEGTDVGNGRTYAATVLGYDVGDDVAVIRLAGASHLATVKTATSPPSAGVAVVALGNAGGTGGKPHVSVGRVVALGQSITADDPFGGAEHLTGMIGTDAGLQPGDSGGPLVAAASGAVIGMDTAGSSGFRLSSSSGEGFAVPIGRALAIATAVEHRHATAAARIDGGAATVARRIHLGPTAFLGVTVSSSSYVSGSGSFASGALVNSVISGGPAARAGISAGDIITAVAGHSVSSPSAIEDELISARPGQTIAVQYLAPDGSQQTAKVKLISGPPQ